MDKRPTIAVAQIAVRRGDVEANLSRCQAAIEHAAAEGAHLVVLPECSLSGYLYDDPHTALRAAVERDGPELAALADACSRAGVLSAIGVLEREGDALYNAAFLIGPNGPIGAYRKAHLPLLGVDRFVQAGDAHEPAVFTTPIGRVGLSICYDIRFPESARSLALAGADLIAHPANWPSEAAILPERFVSVRACENRVFFAAANRGDAENGTSFVGGSRVADIDGTVLCAAERGEALLLAEVDLRKAREKLIVRRPGAFETDLFGDRRPELYGVLTSQEEP
jgi:predicted amidohydrolase